MLPNVRKLFVQLAVALALLTASGFVAVAQESWRVDKSSGETWVTKNGVQPAALSQETTLQPGDGVRTGRNGRVLLVRGEERILVSPNTVIAIPQKANEGIATTVVQQAGSILLQVEKRDTKHFEVETPYLAAVVKGTEFRVTVSETGTKVDVVQGKVEVADFKSGQFALVLPGQTAGVSANGEPGLSLSGTGTLSPIQQGPPRATAVQRIAVPKGGLTAPATGPGRSAASLKGPESNKGLLIKSAVGEVKLNFHKVTNGLARDASSTGKGQKATVWKSEASSANDGRGRGNASAHSNASSGMGSMNSNAHAAAHGKSKEHHANNGHGKGGNPGNGGGNGGGGNGGGGNGGGGNGGGGNGGGGNGGGGNGGGGNGGGGNGRR